MAEARQYVTLGIAKEIFAVPVAQVHEILDVCSISALPQAPAYLLGMIDVRGQGVPVIDLRTRIGLPSAADTRDTRIVVLTVTANGRERMLSLKADRVFEVTCLDNDNLEPPPEIGIQWQSHMIAGVGRRNGAFVTVLNLDLMFALEQIPSSAEAVERSLAQSAA